MNCVNYELCETEVSHNFVLCKNCIKWGKLKFVKTIHEKCMLCKTKTQYTIIFPNMCGHSFCVECTRYLLFCDEISTFNISPVPFGCPPCPNGCFNTEKGNQCQCIIYDKVIEDWWNSDTDAGERFAFACYLDGKSRVHSKINCPLCSDNNLIDQEPNDFMKIITYVFIVYPQYLSHYFIES